MKQAFSTAATPDLASVGSYLRRYARFEGEAPPPATPPAPPTDTPPANGGNGDAKFTQADLDRIAGATRKDAKAAAVAELLKELGLEKTDDLKTLVTTAREREEAQKTEAQKAVERAEKAEQRAQEAEERAVAIEAQRVLDRRDSAIRSKAVQAFDVTNVLEWANRAENADLLAKTVSADGVVSEKAVDDLIAACQKAAGHLWKKGGVGSPSNSDGRVPGAPNKAAQDRASRLSQSRIRG